MALGLRTGPAGKEHARVYGRLITVERPEGRRTPPIGIESQDTTGGSQPVTNPTLKTGFSRLDTGADQEKCDPTGKIGQ